LLADHIAANHFQAIPEPGTLALMTIAVLLWVAPIARKRWMRR